MFGGMLLTVLLSREMGTSIPVLLIGVSVFFIFPLIFINNRFTIFTKMAVVEFTNDFLNIKILNKTTFDLEEESQYLYSDISSVRMTESVSDSSSYLKLVLKGGTKVKYLFYEQSDNEQNVLKNVRSFFSSYNHGKVMDQKISLLPGFYASTGGKYSIMGLTILIGITILFQIIYKPVTIPFSLITGIILFLRIKSQQKKDTEVYESLIRGWNGK
jgi:hypothetical protein